MCLGILRTQEGTTPCCRLLPACCRVTWELELRLLRGLGQWWAATSVPRASISVLVKQEALQSHSSRVLVGPKAH